MHSTYKLLDSGNFLKLEEIGPYRLVRPSLQSVWKPHLPDAEWKKADATFKRDESGKGVWEFKNKKPLPAQWKITSSSLQCVIKLTDFGHVGIFPEHHKGGELERAIASFKSQQKEFRLLNLFAYTGIVSLLAANAGAQVVHVDASKKSVEWAKENAQASDMQKLPIRWLVDDVRKFIEREIRRGSTYHGIILDPPSFGRGPNGELWKIEEHISDFMESLVKLMDKDFAYLQFSCHSPGFTPLTLTYLTDSVLPKAISEAGELKSLEMTIPEWDSKRSLPSGVCCIYSRK
jgi:23S rRNA (cytosine1962-C5)-methyltransferase